MEKLIHLTSGDTVGESLQAAGLPGEVWVWQDLLYEGPRTPGWPDDVILDARAAFLEESTDGGLSHSLVLETLKSQYARLSGLTPDTHIVLWFDACLFDQSMLVHILTCLQSTDVLDVELLCVDAYPGVDPYHGLGQLTPGQLAGLYGKRRPVTREQIDYAIKVDHAFGSADMALLATLAAETDTPLPWIPAAAARWIDEQPDPTTGLGRLESLSLAAIRAGCKTPGEVFNSVSKADSPPQYWGDTTLWKKINDLASRPIPLIQIDGPAPQLPQWESDLALDDFTLEPRPVS